MKVLQKIERCIKVKSEREMYKSENDRERERNHLFRKVKVKVLHKIERIHILKK